MATMEDYIAEYPDQYDPDIQRKTTCKQEFIELSGKTYEPPPEIGNKYSHQEYFLRLMRQYDRILKFDSPGSGKACTIVGLAEYYSDNPGEYEHVYILEKGPSTIQDIRHQIMCRCTKDKYETDRVKQSVDSRSRTANITNALKSWYTITTYKKFATEILTMTDAQIKAKFSRCHIYIDEAHTLRNAEEESRTPRRKTPGKQKKKTIINTEAYKMIWKVFHIAESIKCVITTATPNINNVGDCIPLLNLLLPVERQLPPHSVKSGRTQSTPGFREPLDPEMLSYDYRFVTMAQMEPFLRGIISYVRAFDNDIIVKNMGVKTERLIEIEYVDPDAEVEPLIEENGNGEIEYFNQDIPEIEMKLFEAQTVVYPVRMSEFQSKVYKKASISHAKTGKKAKGISARHHASDFVFPDESYGGNLSKFLGQEEQIKAEQEETFGLATYVTTVSNETYIASEELKEILRDPELLWKHSCKFYEIIRIEETNPGKCFIFTDAVTGAGAILLSLMFEEWGYTRYNEDESAFTQ